MGWKTWAAVIVVAAIILALALLLQGGGGTGRLESLLQEAERGETFKVVVAGRASGYIDRKYTCDGEDVSPRIEWNGLPEGTKSIAVIVYDPDAPRGIFVHWVAYNIPPKKGGLGEAIPRRGTVDEVTQGVNDFGKIGYGGPCPPGGVHRYVFLVLALDYMPGLQPGLSAKQLLSQVRGHVIGYGKATLRYGRG